MSNVKLTSESVNWEVSAARIYNRANNLTLDASSNSNILLSINGSNRLRITDASSIFLNSVDLSANSLVRVGSISFSSSCIIRSITNPATSYDNFLNYDASTNLVVYNYFTLPVGTTSTRPSPAVTGMMRYNTTTGSVEFYNGSSWTALYQPTAATLTLSAGLTGYSTIIYTDSANNVIGAPTSGGYTIYVFKDTSLTAPGTTRTGTITPNFTGSITCLVVGGGGGGGGAQAGGDAAGGGGAGGYFTTSLTVTASIAYTTTAGAGGAGGVGLANGSNGSNSVFSTITSAGGGGGAGGAFLAGSAGGSGGGGGTRNSAAGGAGNTPSTTPSQGNNGGAALAGNTPGTARGGGGGGSGSVGVDGTTSGNGGSGTTSTITGTSTTYAAGGGGAGYDRAGGSGTAGVSGNGVSNSVSTPADGSPGTNGRGGGGGGAGSNASAQTGGAGGSGVVILKFLSFF